MKLYIASTSEYAGKTLLALALGTIWKEGGVRVGYVKPLGKIPEVREGRLVDGDATFLADALPWTRRPTRSARSDHPGPGDGRLARGGAAPAGEDLGAVRDARRAPRCSSSEGPRTSGTASSSGSPRWSSSRTTTAASCSSTASRGE